ncbi:hypothetical protein E5D57_006909 [Metarhizium anisopliae]|nr:hypothetical protein E5D57_006909 [Metarhizium anisopliae]
MDESAPTKFKASRYQNSMDCSDEVQGVEAPEHDEDYDTEDKDYDIKDEDYDIEDEDYDTEDGGS